MNLGPELTKRLLDTTEDVFGIPRGLISRDPEAAALIATLPCPNCGCSHGVNPCPTPIGNRATIPAAPSRLTS